MAKKFGAVQDEYGLWQLHYVNSFHGSKNLCFLDDREKVHDHPSPGAAECCAVALSNIDEQFIPATLEKPRGYVAPIVAELPPEPVVEEVVEEPIDPGEEAATDLEDDVVVEVEIADDNESHDEDVTTADVEVTFDDVDESGQVEDPDDEEEE